MLNFALQCDGDRLEAAVRMLSNAQFGFRGFEVFGRGVVKHEERANLVGECEVGEDRLHAEPVADPVLTHGGQKLLKGFIGHSGLRRTS